MLKEKNSFNLKSFMMNHALHLIMVLMIVVIACISPKFLSLRVLRDILTQSSTRIVVALGCMFVIISGSADLSGGRTVGLAAVIAGSLAQQAAYGLKFWPELPELPVIVPVLISILAGLVVGCANGFIVAKLKVPAFLATLGTQMVVYGANCLYFNKAPNNSQPLGGYLPGFSSLGTGNIAGIPILVIIALVLCVVVWVLQTKTCLGKEIFAVGGNLEAVRVSGINVFKIQMITYSIAGACYGLAVCLEGTGGLTFSRVLTPETCPVEHILAFDLTSDSVGGIRAGLLDGVVAQDQRQMGIIALDEVLRFAREGHYSGAVHYTDSFFVSAENLDEALSKAAGNEK